jgi:hypothetical protein
MFSNFLVQTPLNTDFTQYHSFGFLWVPATTATLGYAQYYFDNEPTSDIVTWAPYTGEAPPPGLAPWTFGILDSQHLALLLGNGPNEPMTIRSVNVWQASAAANIKQ